MASPTCCPDGAATVPDPAEVADVLDRLEVPLDVSTRAAQRALREAGSPAGRAAVVAGVRMRRQRGRPPEPPGTASGTPRPVKVTPEPVPLVPLRWPHGGPGPCPPWCNQRH